MSVLLYDPARKTHILGLRTGPWANRRWITAIRVCANPCCPCFHLNFQCAPEDPASAPTLHFTLDAEKHSLSPDPASPLSHDSRALVRTLVAELDASSGFRIFVTAGSSPCLTPFKPVLPLKMPAGVDQGGPRYSDDSYWWRHEAFRIQAEMRLTEVQGPLLKEIRELEGQYCTNIPFSPWEGADRALLSASEEAFFRSSALEASWLQAMKSMDRDARPLHNAFWKSIARRNHVPFD